MLINPIIAMLHNSKYNTYHPIIFTESPLPGDAPTVRHKSAGHHTTGFSSREDAVKSATATAEQANARLCLHQDLEWDGEGVPAMKVFFANDDQLDFSPADNKPA